MLFQGLERLGERDDSRLRWVVFAVTVACAAVAYRRRMSVFGSLFGIIAALYNPFFPFRPPDSVWDLLCMGTALFLLGSIAVVDRHMEPEAGKGRPTAPSPPGPETTRGAPGASAEPPTAPPSK
jgi:hypothetical protein